MQKSFSDLEYAPKKKLTRRDRFLAEIDSVTPWGKLHQAVEPLYPKVEGAGRPPIGLARMLRMYVAQQCFGLSDEGIEDAIYDSQSIRAFVDIDLGRESAPDATTLLKFRRLLEAKGLTRQIFDTINGHLAEKGLMMREGTIVDATLIAAPPSTKNKDGKRDPEMHQSKKGNDWHFGMKAHVRPESRLNFCLARQTLRLFHQPFPSLPEICGLRDKNSANDISNFEFSKSATPALTKETARFAQPRVQN